MCESVEPHI